MDLKTLRDAGKFSEITYEILCELVKRKDKERICKRNERIAGFCLMFILTGLILLFSLLLQKSDQTLAQISGITDNPLLSVLIILSLMMAAVFFRFHTKREEAEDDFEALRKEVIERAGELWLKEPGSKGRYETMQYLLKTNDINLFYK